MLLRGHGSFSGCTRHMLAPTCRWLLCSAVIHPCWLDEAWVNHALLVARRQLPSCHARTDCSCSDIRAIQP